MQTLCVVVLTLDEEVNLGKALASVAGRAPALVLDSGSRDRTVEIAREHGAEVHVREFDDYAAQRNHAVELVRDRFTWVLFLDADEEVSEAMWHDVEATVVRNDVDGAYFGLHLRMLGYDLVHGGPGHYAGLRLLRTAVARFDRGVNERADDQGLRTVRLASKILHDDRKPLSAWFEKHVRYARREAAAYLDGEDRDRGLRGFGLATKGARMVGVRWAYGRMPLFLRPFAQFGRTVALQGAWRDGLPGLMFAGMQSLWYPMLIDLMIHEERRRRARANEP